MKIIYTLTGDEVFVDDAFYDILSTKTWYTIKSARTSYARCYHKGEHLYMHRLVMEEPVGMVVDHMDCNGMNNQRENLQVVTQAENTRLIGVRNEASLAYDRWKRIEKSGEFTECA